MIDLNVAPAGDRMIAARAGLLMDHTFFGSLAAKLKLVPGGTDTACTDGRSLWYSERFVDESSDELLQFLMAHEVMHCALHHHTRRGSRDPRLWNMACDYAVNWLLSLDGFRIPEGFLFDARFAGQAAEQIYDTLLHEQQQQQDEEQQEDEQQGGAGDEDEEEGEGEGGAGEANGEDNGEEEQPGAGGAGAGEDEGEATDEAAGQPGAKGGAGAGAGEGAGELADVAGAVTDAPDPIEDDADWQVSVKQAEQVAKMMGQGAGKAQAAVAEANRPRVDWKAFLRRFMQERARADYSWRAPNRRYIGQSLYLPEVRSEALPPVVLVRDTSGSTMTHWAQFMDEIQSIIDEVRPEKTLQIDADWDVANVQEFEPGDMLDTAKRAAHGGGGTSFVAPFQYVERAGMEPACLIYFTDGYGTYPDREPDYPVVWLMTTDEVAPWGETIRMDLN